MTPRALHTPVLLLLLPSLSILLLAPNTEIFSLFDFIYDQKRLALLGGLLIFLAFAILVTPIRRFLSISWYAMCPLSRVLLLILCGFSVLATASATWLHVAMLETSTLAALVLLSIGIGGSIMRHGQSVSYAIIITATLSAAWYEVIWLTNVLAYVIEYKQSPDFQTPFVNFAHVRFVNQFQVAWIAFIPTLAFFAAKKYPGRLAIMIQLVGALWFTLLYASQGRGAIVAISVALAALWLLRDNYSHRLFCALVRNALLGLLIYLTLYLLLPYALGGEPFNLLNHRLWATHMHDSGRFMLWQHGLQLMVANPLLGAGPMHYPIYFPQLPGHPHSSLVQIGAEYGIPATLLVSFLYIYSLYAVYRSKTSPLKPAIFFSLIALGLYSLLSGVIVMPLSQLSVALVSAIAIGHVHQHNHPKQQRNTMVLATVVAMVLTVQLSVVVPETRKRLRMQSDMTILKIDTPVMYPRYWQNSERKSSSP